MIGHQISSFVILPVLAVVGLFVGRFLNICIERFPVHEYFFEQLRSVFKPWTICRRCSAAATFLERLPVVSSIVGKYRCHACGSRLPVAFPVIEVITAALFVLVYWCEIPTGAEATVRDGGLTSIEGPPGPEVITTVWTPIVWLHLRYALHMLMICGLVVATEIDRRLRIIPDGATVPIMIFAVLANVTLAQVYVVPIWFQDASIAKTLQPLLPGFLDAVFVPWDPAEFIAEYPRLHGLLVSLLGVFAGAGTVWMVRFVGSAILQREAMGFGDVVLMAMIGSVLGWQPSVAIFLIGAPVLALFFAMANWLLHSDNEIPYGPFLSAAAILLLVTWPYSWPFAKRFFDVGPLLLPMAVGGVFSLGASLILVQLIKRLLGITDAQELSSGDGGWSSADHLSYYKSERPLEQTGQWEVEQWPGALSGRGQHQQHNWERSS